MTPRWPPSIYIGFVGSKRRYFKRMPAENHQNDAELGANRLGSRKDVRDLLGSRAGRNVVVGGFDSHDHVAHATADEVGLVALASQRLNDVHRRIRFHDGYNTFGWRK